MRKKYRLVFFVILLGALAASAQRRPAKEEQASPVEVTRSATLRVTIAADPTTLFDYLADARKLESWFPDQAVFEPQLLGKYHFRWKDKIGVWSGIVTDFIRGNTLGFTWKAPDEEYETNVKFKLSAQGNEALLDLTHSGFLSDALMDKAVKNWLFYLENLKSVVETGNDLRQQASPKSTHRPARSSRRPD